MEGGVAREGEEEVEEASLILCWSLSTGDVVSGRGDNDASGETPPTPARTREGRTREDSKKLAKSASFKNKFSSLRGNKKKQQTHSESSRNNDFFFFFFFLVDYFGEWCHLKGTELKIQFNSHPQCSFIEKCQSMPS